LKIINRLLLVVGYKQDFLDFLTIKNKGCGLDLKSLNADPEFYLIREPNSDDDYSGIIKDNIQNIFSSIYEGFSDEQYTISEKEFELFFDVGCSEMVRDLSDSDTNLAYESVH
jgi:hypothetical protein